MKNSNLFTTTIILLGVLFNMNITYAQTASGRIIYTTIEEARPAPKSMNGVSFQNGMFKARLETDNSKSPFNKATGVCENWLVPGENGNAFIHGVCIFADPDGSTFVTYSSSKAKDKSSTIHIKGGTGKFLNLDGTGTSSKTLPLDADLKVDDCCMSTWKIKYKM